VTTKRSVIVPASVARYYGAVRIWILAGTIAATGLATTVMATSCGGGPGKPHPGVATKPGTSSQTGPGGSTTTTVRVADGGTDVSAAAETDISNPRARRAAQGCPQPSSTIANHPDGGVVFNNAMTSADAGFIDRMQRIVTTLEEQGDRFRCCFDLWQPPQASSEPARVMLVVVLEANGDVRTATVDESRTTAKDEDMVWCVAEVARTTTYPPSPTGKSTIVEYPFVVARALETGDAG
jgi:hypothetical protein